VDVDPLDEPTPCDECPHYARCAREKLSCAAFGVFVWLGRWGAAPREPTRTNYVRQFAADDPKRGCAPGLRPATLAKFEALRALRGEFRTAHAALAAVDLDPNYWQHIRTRDAALAAHVQSLVVPRSRGR
jgi:hypothetical protein